MLSNLTDESLAMATTPEHERLVSLEMLVLHLQHDLEQLNQALVAQQRQLDQLGRRLDQLDRKLEQADPSHPLDPGQERPPHY